METRYKLLTTTLIAATLLNTGCSLQQASTKEKKIQQTNEKKKETYISAKDIINRNAEIDERIALLNKNIKALEEKIMQTNHGKDRAKLVKNKVRLEEKIEKLQNKKMNNAKEFQLSQQKKNEKINSTQKI